MDIERLTKTQIVLLTLLISFITSIATGIVTVTLLEQAPPAVTRTISRVVERTIERVVPDKNQNASVITKEVIVVVKENDLITESIEKNTDSVVRITAQTMIEEPENYEGTETFVGLGIIVSSDGIIATDNSLIVPELQYKITLSSGEVFNAIVLQQNEESDIALLEITSVTKKITNDEVSVEDEEIVAPVFSPVILSDLEFVKLGQSVIALSGKEQTSVAVGIISRLFEEEVILDNSLSNTEEDTIEKDITSQFGDFLLNKIVESIDSEQENQENKEQTSSIILSAIETTINQHGILPGSPLVDIFGETIGIYLTSGVEGNAVYAPIHVVESALTALAATVALSAEEAVEEIN